MERERFIDRRVHAVTEYRSARSFMQASKVPQGYNTIYEAGLPIDILCQNRGFDTTVVFLHGAIDTSWKLPVAAGIGVSRDVAVNRIFITDPSLNMSKELTLGWFAGNKHQRLQIILTDVIGKILDSFGNQRLAFFGTSGGGFASLYYSAQFDDSLAIAVNPQTSIERHTVSAVRRYTEACFGDYGGNPTPGLPYDITTDLVELYSSPVRNTIAYMQNSTDKLHIRIHEQPFYDALDGRNRVYGLSGNDWGDGHVAAPKDTTTNVLMAAASADWGASLERQGFSRAGLLEES